MWRTIEEKKYNNSTLLRLRAKVNKENGLKAANDYVDYYQKSCVALKQNNAKKKTFRFLS